VVAGGRDLDHSGLFINQHAGTLLLMSLRVYFVGGPADHTEHEYLHYSAPLPSLWWCENETPERGAVYHRIGVSPDATGRWRYEFIDR
jgi:hypothetical protein